MDAWRQELRDEQARAIINSGREEIPRSDLAFGRHWIEDRRTGYFYRAYGGDPFLAGHAPAFYVTEDGTPIILERADPASRTEFEAKRAALAERRAKRDAEAQQRREQKKALTR